MVGDTFLSPAFGTDSGGCTFIRGTLPMRKHLFVDPLYRCSLVAMFFTTLAIPALSWGADASAFAGMFSNGTLTVTLSSGADGLSGSIKLGQQEYPATATVQNNG